MNVVVLIYLLGIIASMVIVIQLAVSSSKSPRESWTPSFILLMSGIVLWFGFYLLQLFSSNQNQLILFVKLGYAGILTIPTALFFFAIHYAGLSRWISPSRIWVFIIIPLLTWVLIWTNENHHLFWTGIETIKINGLSQLRSERGWLFWLHTAYSYLLILIGLILIAYAFIGISYPNRKKMVFIMVGIAFPWVINIISTIYVNNTPFFDYTPIALALSLLIFSYGALRLGFLDISPLAGSEIFECMDEGVVVLDNKNRVLDMNLAMEKILDQPKRNLLNMPVSFIFKDWDIDFSFITDSDLLDSEVVMELENKGKILNIRLSSLVKPDNQAMGKMFLFRDKTAQKFSEYSLREKEEKYLGIYSSIRDAIFVETLDGKILDVNPSACDMYGYSYEEFLGKTVWDLVPKGKPVVLPGNPDAQKPENGLIETINIRSNGEQFPVELSSSIRYIGDQQEMIVIVRDITERKVVEESLVDREDYLQMLNRITMTSLQANDFLTMLQSLADQMGELFKATGCYITLWDEKNRQVIPKAASGPLKEIYPSLKVAEKKMTMTESVLNHGKPLVADDVFNSPYISSEVASQFPEKSMLGLPLISGTQKLGAALITFDTFHHFTPEEITRGEQVSAQIALAVAKAQLLEEAERLLEETRLMNEHLENRVQERTSLLRSVNKNMEEEMAERLRMEVKIRERLGIERALSGISTSFVNTSDFHTAVQETLGTIGNLTKASRVYLFLLKESGVIMDNTHEWCAEGVEPQQTMLRDLPTDIFPWWMKKLYSNEVIHIEDVSNMPIEAQAEKQILEEQDIKSLLVFPVFSDSELNGFIGLDNIYLESEWSQDDLDILGVFTQMIGSALHRKKVEEALREERALLALRVDARTAELSAANLELERAIKTKDEFLATMSHELRTPLNAILGLSEALLEGVYGDLVEAQTKTIKTIENSGRHLLTLINDILDLSKIEAGKLEVQFDWVVLNNLCQSSLLFIRQSAITKNIEVVFNLLDGNTKFWADERRMKQILVNLLSNAVKFTPDGKKIGLEVGFDEEMDMINFCVWDQGIGIASEHLSKLFKPFMQIDSSLSRKHSGTGLGLVLVLRLAELHRGSVSVESTPGYGSKFFVSIPMKPLGNSQFEQSIINCDRVGYIQQEYEPESNVTSAVSDSVPIWNSTSMEQDGTPGNQEINKPLNITPKILLAEDNETNIEMTRDYLTSNGYQIIVARNGNEAINQACQYKPDIILMDIQMPEMDGLEAIREIRAIPIFKTTPIIALTALAMPGDREKCLEAGANEYISKPVALKKLKTLLGDYLNV